ncbi:MAG: hypothetical protein WC553_02165 [Patescibacteria group bacterium]
MEEQYESWWSTIFVRPFCDKKLWLWAMVPFLLGAIASACIDAFRATIGDVQSLYDVSSVVGVVFMAGGCMLVELLTGDRRKSVALTVPMLAWLAVAWLWVLGQNWGGQPWTFRLVWEESGLFILVSVLFPVVASVGGMWLIIWF